MLVAEVIIGIMTTAGLERAAVGRRGEDLAARYLSDHGWQIVDRNWRPGTGLRGELDLVALEPAGTAGEAARKWGMGELSRTAKEQEIGLEDLPVAPEQIADLQALVDSGRLTDKLARQVLEGVLAGEGDPEAVAAARGLEVVSDDSALLAAVDEALAANPDVADKIRGGKVQAAGAIVGAVMKATRGQADAKRVRELVMERVQG